MRYHLVFSESRWANKQIMGRKPDDDSFNEEPEERATGEPRYHGARIVTHGGKRWLELQVRGLINEGKHAPRFGYTSPFALLETIREVRGADGLLLRINSGGGSVAGIPILRNAIRNFQGETIAVVEGACLSAAYWLATACQKIVSLDPLARIGGLGAFAQVFDDAGMLKRMGLARIEVYATKSTDKNSATRKAIDGNVKEMQQDILDPIVERMLEDARSGRGSALADADTLATGKDLSATSALMCGWIDSIQDTEEGLYTPTAPGVANGANNSIEETAMKETNVLGARDEELVGAPLPSKTTPPVETDTADTDAGGKAKRTKTRCEGEEEVADETTAPPSNEEPAPEEEEEDPVEAYREAFRDKYGVYPEEAGDRLLDRPAAAAYAAPRLRGSGQPAPAGSDSLLAWCRAHNDDPTACVAAIAQYRNQSNNQ